MNGKTTLKILVALALLLVGQPWMNMYLVEEALTILLCIAVPLTLMLLTAMAFLLLWHGASFVILLLKRIVRWITSLRGRPLRARQAMSHPLSGH